MRSVPLLHQQVNSATNSTPLQDALALNANRWAALGINTRAILPQQLTAASFTSSTSSSSNPSASSPSLGLVLSSAAVRPMDLSNNHHNVSSSPPFLRDAAAPPPPSHPSSLPQQAPSPAAPVVRVTGELQRVAKSIAEAKEASHYHSTAKSGGGGGGGKPSFWNKGKQNNGKRPRESGDKEGEPSTSSSSLTTTTSTAAASSAVESANSVADASSPAATTNGGSRKPSGAAPSKKPPENSKSKSSSKPPKDAFAVSPSSLPPVVPKKTTLFSFQNARQAASSTTSTSTAYTLITEDTSVAYRTLFDAIMKEIRDTERMHAPQIGIGVFNEQTKSSNFSTCLHSNGKMMCADGAVVASRSVLASEQIVTHVVLSWNSQLYVLPRRVGFQLVLDVSGSALLASLSNGNHDNNNNSSGSSTGGGGGSSGFVPEWITFFASSTILPLIAFHRCRFKQIQCSPKKKAPPQGGEEDNDNDDGGVLPSRNEYQQWRFPVEVVSDVRVMTWMLSPHDVSHDFDLTVNTHFGSDTQTSSSSTSAPSMSTLEGVCDRVAQTMQLHRRLYGSLGSRGLLQPFVQQERPMTLLCSLMKYEGFLVNVTEVEAFKKQALDELSVLRQRALDLVTPHMTTFNVQSPEDCRMALYGIHHLDQHLNQAGDFDVFGGDDTVLARGRSTTTKTGKLSTAEDVLKQLEPFHPLPGVILSYRKTAKLLQTYVEGMLDVAAPLGDDFFEDCHDPSLYVDELRQPVCLLPGEQVVCRDLLLEEGVLGVSCSSLGDVLKHKLRRIHANFLQEGTDTGRLSCADPNLQNLPRLKGDLIVHNPTSTTNPSSPQDASSLFSVRGCFVGVPGCMLVAVDYEQIELRVLAHLCGDASLVESLSSTDAGQRDVHRRIAALVFRKPFADVTKEERTKAKRVVFGVLYGMGPRNLAAQLNCTFDHAVDIQNAFKNAFPQIDRYHNRVLSQCRQDNGSVRTLTGRLRLLPEINDGQNMARRSLAERQAFNTVIQGSAADIVKRAMVAVHRDLLTCPDAADVRLHCQIHDELVFSVPTRHLRWVIPRIEHCMTTCVQLSVPLNVVVNVGPNLGNLQVWTP